MGNYKIRVANEAESKEVQEFLKSNGYERKLGSFKLIDGWVCINERMMILCVSVSQAGDELNEYKELTLPQLKDLVVLKRNDVGDATHEDGFDGKFIKINNFWHWFKDGAWSVSEQNLHYHNNLLKPIEKKMSILDTGRLEMKEYLVKNVSDGSYNLVNACVDSNAADGVEAIEVPVGADTATIEKENAVYFWNEANNTTFADGVWNICDEFNFVFLSDYLLDNNNRVIWKRETLNDKVASAEVARVESKLNSVDETLKERQSTYGDFTHVANTTGKLMAEILNGRNSHILPYAHQEALHMICSKMARIVNGDCNFIDNWHDISGYATLIEKSIRGKNIENRCED